MSPAKFIIGLTGGIGSGKSAASDYLASKDITVVDADQVARQVVEPGQPALNAIRARFGDQVILADGNLDRRALRDIVFADNAAPDARTALEGITHPAIGKEIVHQLQQAQSPYAVLVSPLLLETLQHKMTQRILLIDVPEVLQVQRTTTRDQVAESQVQSIIQAQMPRQLKRQKADDIIVNDGSLKQLYKELDALHTRYLEMASQ